jgi:uroporphyrinogen decarboxylase
MDHWERIRAAQRGQETDRVPICLWRHWPIEDQAADSLAAAMLRWQREYDCDLVKHAPAGSYVVEDWGGQTAYIPEKDRGLGVRTMLRYAVEEANQWPRLEQLDVRRGHLGRQLEAVRLVVEELKGSVPILQTVFSPLNIGPKLAGERALADMRGQPEIYKEGLQIMAETTARFALASIEAGAHGIVFVAPCNRRLYSEAEYREFGEPFDRIVLDAVRPQAEIILILALGEEIMFDLIAAYPADAINWRDRTSGPSLNEAQTRFPGLLMGGIEEERTLLHGPEAAIRAEVRDAIGQTGGRRLIVGPGSTPLTATPGGHFRAAREAIDI